MFTKLLLASSALLANTAAANVIELGLGSATNPHPYFANKIASREGVRESTESQQLKNLMAQYSVIEVNALSQIKNVLAHGCRSSFLGVNPVEPAVKVTVVPSVADESAAAAAFDSLEDKRTSAEKQLFAQAMGELNEFAKVIINTAQSAACGRKGSFLQVVPGKPEGFHRQLTVRLQSDNNYPTISNMAAAAERRRDVAESAIRAQVLSLQLHLARRLNSVLSA